MRLIYGVSLQKIDSKLPVSQDLEISGIISGSWETWTAWSGRSRCSSPPQFRASDLDIDALAKQNEDESSVPDTAEGEDAQATDNS